MSEEAPSLVNEERLERSDCFRVADSERILLIEDTAELNIRKSNLVRFE
jgi:hypothetical protein